ALSPHGRGELRGEPDVDITGWKAEGIRHDADDGMGAAEESQRFSDDVRVALEPTVPQTLANHRGLRSASDFLFRIETAPDQRGRSENAKESRRGAGAGQFLGQLTGSVGTTLGIRAGDPGEAVVHAVPLFETNRGDVLARHFLLRIAFEE